MTTIGHQLITDVLREIGSFDRPFVDWRLHGPSPDTVEALERFWAWPAMDQLRHAVGGPHLEWDTLERSLLSLAQDSTAMIEIDWWGLAEQITTVAGDDRVAAAAVSLYPLAVWAGGELSARPPDPGWFTFPLRAGTALLAADAVSGAEHLATGASQFLQAAVLNVHTGQFAAGLAPYLELGARIADRRDQDVADLAWDLHAACRRDQPNLRPAVAALFWTIGDVPRAELLATGTYLPTLGTIRDLVATSMRRVPDDPFIQYILLAVKDRPPMDLRRHHQLLARLNARYRRTAVHRLDMELPVPASRAYADVLIAHLGGVDVSDDQGAAFAIAGQFVDDVVGDTELLAVLRMRALYNLVFASGPQQRDGWRDLATLATYMLATAVEQGDFTSTDRCLALPSYYCDADGPVHERELLELERHRSAGLRYWLTAAAPPAPADNRLADLLVEEASLLNDLRAARFVRLTPHLPSHYERFHTDMRAMLRDDVDPSNEPPHPLDQDIAATRMRQSWDGLTRLWHRMHDIAPEYSRWRTDPIPDLDDFTAALIGRTPDTRPVGPEPVLRSTQWTAGRDGHQPRSVSPAVDPAPDAHHGDEAGADRLERAELLGDRADELVRQFHSTDDVGALDAAISAEAEACRLLVDRQYAAEYLHHLDKLATMRAGRYLTTGDDGDIAAAIGDHEAAVAQSERPDVSDELRIALRFNAGMSHHHRYDYAGEVDDLRRALDHWQAATQLSTIHNEQASALYATLVNGLRELYMHTEAIEVLDAVVSAQRTLLHRIPPHERAIPGQHANLAADLLVLHSRTADPSHLDGAIDALRSAVDSARGRDARNLMALLNNLASALLARHATALAAEDLDEAITALREAAAIAPIGQQRARLLRALADLLTQRHTERGDPTDAIRAARMRDQAEEIPGDV